MLHRALLAALLLLIAAAPSIAGLRPTRVTMDASCSALPGVSNLMVDRSERYWVFGEVHGSREAPREFGEIVCEAATRGPVIVGIERPPTLTIAMQRFVDSDGGARAQSELLEAYFDGSEWGLSSEGFFELFKRLQALRRSGADVKIFGFQEGPPVAADGDQTPYERGLAAHILRAGASSPDARVLVLVGNLHARRSPVPSRGEWRGFDPMVMHLPQADLLSFDLTFSGGEIYNCTAQGCGARRITGQGDGARRILLSRRNGFDGAWAVGALSAARPLKGSQPRPRATP